MAMAMLRAAAEEERLKRQLIMHRRYLRDTARPYDLPEKEFVANFRFKKSQFRALCEDICPLLAESERTSAVQPEIKVLAAVTFYGHGCYQKNVSSHFELGLSQTTVSECIEEVTNALNTPSILRKYIHFPQKQAEREAVAERFMEKFSFPGGLGCVDGTHVAIIQPGESEEAYFKRKHYHSINAMMICDADLRILHVDASFGGASHDSHVWNSSETRDVMEMLHDHGQAFWLLGDSGYAQRPWMMTPILNAAPNSPEELYTKKHIRTRNCIERCFGVLKTRWRCLLAHRTMHYRPIKAGKIVNACVVLHNAINDARIKIDTEAMALDRARQPLQERAPRTERVDEAIPSRDMLVQRLWRGRETD